MGHLWLSGSLWLHINFLRLGKASGGLRDWSFPYCLYSKTEWAMDTSNSNHQIDLLDGRENPIMLPDRPYVCPKGIQGVFVYWLVESLCEWSNTLTTTTIHSSLNKGQHQKKKNQCGNLCSFCAVGANIFSIGNDPQTGKSGVPQSKVLFGSTFLTAEVVWGQPSVLPRSSEVVSEVGKCGVWCSVLRLEEWEHTK